MAACEDRSATRSVGAGPVATCATASRAALPRPGSRQTMTTAARRSANPRAVAKPTPLLAPVMRTTLPSMRLIPALSTLFGSSDVSTTAWDDIQQRRQLQFHEGVKRERPQHLPDVILRLALHHHPGVR